MQENCKTLDRNGSKMVNEIKRIPHIYNEDTLVRQEVRSKDYIIIKSGPLLKIQDIPNCMEIRDLATNRHLPCLIHYQVFT